MRALLAGLVLSSGSPAVCAAVSETSGAATVDYSAGTVSVAGAAAGDLHAPNPTVARVRAERSARRIAAKRLAATMEKLPPRRLGCRATRPSPPALEEAAARAPLDSIEWSSDGSVSLVVRIALADLLAHGATPDAGSTAQGPGAVVVDPEAQPTWFAERDGACVAAPRFFETWADAQATGGELARGVRMTRDELSGRRAGAGVAPRILAIVRRAGDSPPVRPR